MSRRAVILAGGLGIRLRPYTTTIPKPLLPIGDRPILDIVLRQLQRAGFNDLTIATGHLAELIEAFVGDGRKYDVHADYFREDRPLGTVGALALIERLDEPFLVMNGDVLTDLDYRALLDAHIAGGAAATIASRVREVQIPLGVLKFDDASDPQHLTDYIEKPTHSYTASMGVYCFRPDVAALIEPHAHMDFPDLVTRLIERGERVQQWPCDGYWLDIGMHDDYERAQEDWENIRTRLLPEE